MSDSPYRTTDVGAGEPLDCLFCGAELELNANRCKKCGVSCAVHPDETDFADSYPCPRCTHPLAPTSFGRARIEVCETCHGVFLPSVQYSMIVNDYLSDAGVPLGLMLPPLPPGKEIDRVAIVKCIACHKEMDRVNFASRSNAVIDVCIVHGIWLDAGELVPMLHFVKMRAELGEVPLSRDERADQTLLDIGIEQAKHEKVASKVNFFTTLEYVRKHGF